MALVFRAVYCAIIAVVELKEVLKDYILKSINVTSFFYCLRDPFSYSCRFTPCWGPFLESPGNFSGTERDSKISNLRITELLYSRTLSMNRGSPRTRTFRRIDLSVFRYR